MSEPTERIHEAYSTALRGALLAGLQIAEMIARQRRQLADAARHASETQARQVAQRMRAEREAAMPLMRQPWQERWWARSSPERIAETWRVTAAWAANGDPYARAVQERMREEIRDRWGIELPDIPPGQDSLAGVLAAARDQARTGRSDGRSAGADEDLVGAFTEAGKPYRWEIRQHSIPGAPVVASGTATLLDGEALELLAADQLARYEQERDRNNDGQFRPLGPDFQIEIREASAGTDSAPAIALAGDQIEATRQAVTEQRARIVAGDESGASAQQIRDALVVESRRVWQENEQRLKQGQTVGQSYKWSVSHRDFVRESDVTVRDAGGVGTVPPGMSPERFAAEQFRDWWEQTHPGQDLPNYDITVQPVGSSWEHALQFDGERAKEVLADPLAVDTSVQQAAREASQAMQEADQNTRETIAQLRIRIEAQEAWMRGENGDQVAQLYALRVALDDAWWETASPEEIAGVWDYVQGWDKGPIQGQAESMIGAGIYANTGITVDYTAATTGEQLREQIEDAYRREAASSAAPDPDRPTPQPTAAQESGQRFGWRLMGTNEAGHRRVIATEIDTRVGDETAQEAAARLLREKAGVGEALGFTDVYLEVGSTATYSEDAFQVRGRASSVDLADGDPNDDAGPAAGVDPARVARGEEALAAVEDTEAASAARIAAAGFPEGPEAAVSRPPSTRRAAAPTTQRTIDRTRQQPGPRGR